MAKFIGGQSKYLIIMAKVSRIAGFIWLALFLYTSFVMLTHMNWFSLASEFAYLLVFGPILLLINNQLEKHYSLLINFQSGISGETAVWKELQKLDDQYTVFEDLKIPGHKENIDFIVVSTTGIHFIEVKNHFGEISYDGEQLLRNNKKFVEGNILKRSLSEAMELHNYLVDTYKIDIFINPIIVFSNSFAKVRFGQKPINHVHVIQRRWLLDTIKKNTVQSVRDQSKLIDILMTLVKNPEKPYIAPNNSLENANAKMV